MRPNKLSTSSHIPSRAARGQSFTELVLFLPVLIIMLAGMAEVVLVFNDYLQMLDGVRAGARYISDSDPYPEDWTNPGEYDNIKQCDGSGATENFFRSAACVTEDGLVPIVLTEPAASRSKDLATGECISPSSQVDDIVISVFGTYVSVSGIEIKRYDNNNYDSTAVDPTPKNTLIRDDDGNDGSNNGENSGWSYMADKYGNEKGMCSKFTTDQVRSYLLTTAPSTGIVLVEVFYNHPQIFDMPIFGDVIPNPVPLYAYAFFPLVAAEPTPSS